MEHNSQGELRADEAGELRRFVVICAVIAALCVALKMPTLFFQRAEYDERVYWEVTWNWLNNGSYSLRNMPVLKELPASVYDRPLFHHPPLLSILLSPFVWAGSFRYAILVSWLGHALAVCGVAMACWTWRSRSWRATHFLLWLPVLAVALDPLMGFCSRKLWPDNLVGGFGGLSLGFLCIAIDRRRAGWAVAAGISIGMSALAKLPGLALSAPALLMIAMAPAMGGGRRLGSALGLIGGVAAVVMPWFLVFYRQYGAWTPDWIRPDAELISASPLVARAMSQSWHYYPWQSILTAPVVLVVCIALFKRPHRLKSPWIAAALAWTVVPWLFLLFLRLQGHSQQLRFLTVAVPGFYALLSLVLSKAHPRRSLLPVTALAAVLYGAVHGGFYMLDQRSDEIVPVPEILWRSFQGPPAP